jgi:hypothetical protein
MASQGPNNPTAAVDDTSSGSRVWSNPTNVFSSNNTYAQASTFLATNVTHGLKVTGFGFTVPTGSTINGIVMEAERHCDSVGSIPDEDSIGDTVVRLLKGGTQVGNNYRVLGGVSPWSSGDVYRTYGGTTDLWGTTWTAEEVNSPNFGCWIQAEISSTVGNTSARVDHVRITTYYTPSAGGAPEQAMFLVS